MVVLTRSMAARRASLVHALPHDMAVEIAGHVAATSPTPVTDLGSLRASCRAMRAACGDRDVARRVALEREAGAMRWSDHERYLAVVGSLSGAGNPEACFLAGVALAFTQPQRARPGVELLGQAAKAGHRVAAYVRALLLYNGGAGDEDDARRLIRQVEGEAAAATEQRKSNAECVRCREQAVEAVRQATWRMAELPASAVVALPEDDADRCTVKGCGETEAWYEWAAFCSENCRIRHERGMFFSQLPLTVANFMT
ncbi:unnamed protein product [Urochloa decumbens]|uniref:At2g35280-like TPR domain-containing protein n=1 Tax=Urochloa decumbens TaxID=240449 RepID=A0ABC8ZBL0_9POAL